MSPIKSINRHYLLWCTHTAQVVIQPCPTLCNPVDCSSPGSSAHEILQARILEHVAIPFSRGSSWPRNRTQVSCISGRFFIYYDSSTLFQNLCCSFPFPASKLIKSCRKRNARTRHPVRWTRSLQFNLKVYHLWGFQVLTECYKNQ